MKKLLFIATLFAFTTSKAQTFDTTIKSYAVVPLATPFQPNWTDTTKAFYLNVTISSDNLINSALFHWVLFSKALKPLQAGDMNISNAAYTSWLGDNNLPFNYVAQKLQLNIK
jgi:hypothetical protein